MTLANANLLLGHPQEALDTLLARFSKTEPYEIATVYGWRGDRGRALDWLERAVTQRGGRGVSRLNDPADQARPLLAKIRDDPRYAAVLRKIGLPPG